VQDCQVCGRSFDPLAFQVVVPELGRGFDRIECAHNARALALPSSAVAPAPLAAVVEPLAVSALAAPAAVPALRPVGVPLATLGLLAAGTVTAVYLWLRILGAEPTGFPFSRGLVPKATHDETVQAHVQSGPAQIPTRTILSSTTRPAPEPAPVLVSTNGAARVLSSTARRPTRRFVTRARSTAGESPVHGKGKGHAKHGKGHHKHGETDGVHNPGHGGHGSAASAGTHGKSHGKGHGKGKKH
jgi:hypothetical protein